MLDLGMSQSQIIFAVQESLEGGFEARALSHSIYTEAETLDELKKKVQGCGALPLRGK